MGGFAKVHQSSSWNIVLSQLGFDPNSANVHPDSRLSAITAVCLYLSLTYSLPI